MKTIRDAVHGDIRLDADEMAVLDTPVVQRLRGIKQLGASNLVFPSAVHTRFEHSLGTGWLTKRLLDSLQQTGHAIAPDDRRVACLAALLHDVTHVPFGHTFEDERRLFDRHDEDPARLDRFLADSDLQAALAATSVGQRVRDLLAGRDRGAPFVRSLVTGTVCADLLDYLRRDAYFCGLRLDYDDRLFQYFALCDGELVVRLHKRGAFRRDALSELIHLLQMRYTLTERVYYHHAKVVAGAMVSRALELALASGRFKREELYRLRDDSLLERLTQLAKVVDWLGDVVDDLRRRRLYKRVYLLTMEGFGRAGLSGEDRDALAQRFHSDLENRRLVERDIAEKLGVPEAHLIVYCPSPRMALKEADVPVEVAPGEVLPLSSLRHPDVEALKEKHRGLWRFYVCMRKDHRDKSADASRCCEQVIGHPNQLGPQERGKLAFG